MSRNILFISTLVLLILCGCSQKKNSSQQTIIVALSGDIDTFNPLYTTDATTQEIVELLYPSLVRPSIDTASGALVFTPSLARSFVYQNGEKDVLFHLRSDARWSDSAAVTARDVKFSFLRYGDPAVGSIHQEQTAGMLVAANGAPDIDRSIVVINDSTVLFKFREASPSRMFDIALPIMPAHIYEQIPASELRTHPANKTPIGAGPFILASWKPMQEIVLHPNPLCVLPAPAKIGSLVFRIIPDLQTQLIQLRNKEVDMVMDLEASDAAALQNESSVRILSIEGRRYHFIGWNNIDQQAYARSKGKVIAPHPLFGSARTRQALTLAVNRPALLSALLSNHGTIANGPIAPFFKNAFDRSIAPYPFDPKKATELLAQDGWKDTDGDGILDKDGKKFSFELYTPTGSKFWAELATIVQKQLRDVKIEMKLAKAERSVYWQSLLEKKFDAWIAGFEVPMELRMEGFWGSDLKKSPFNIFSYRNARVDSIVNTAYLMTNQSDATRSWKEFQQILHAEQPCTFLFWEDRLIAVNQRIRNTDINRLHTLYSASQWTVSEN
ncbi:MAG TPA: ABC transporter substrate-binding protein [Bacteroidota bacterium]|nr:ABC transporter substrate-binding protein [Bacteroidota bacterium]